MKTEKMKTEKIKKTGRHKSSHIWLTCFVQNSFEISRAKTGRPKVQCQDVLARADSARHDGHGGTDKTIAQQGN